MPPTHLLQLNNKLKSQSTLNPIGVVVDNVPEAGIGSLNLYCDFVVLTLKVLVTTIDALGHF